MYLFEMFIRRETTSVVPRPRSARLAASKPARGRTPRARLRREFREWLS